MIASDAFGLNIKEGGQLNFARLRNLVAKVLSNLNTDQLVSLDYDLYWRAGTGNALTWGTTNHATFGAFVPQCQIDLLINAVEAESKLKSTVANNDP